MPKFVFNLDIIRVLLMTEPRVLGFTGGPFPYSPIYCLRSGRQPGPISSLKIESVDDAHVSWNVWRESNWQCRTAYLHGRCQLASIHGTSQTLGESLGVTLLSLPTHLQ